MVSLQQNMTKIFTSIKNKVNACAIKTTCVVFPSVTFIIHTYTSDFGRAKLCCCHNKEQAWIAERYAYYLRCERRK